MVSIRSSESIKSRPAFIKSKKLFSEVLLTGVGSVTGIVMVAFLASGLGSSGSGPKRIEKKSKDSSSSSILRPKFFCSPCSEIKIIVKSLFCKHQNPKTLTTIIPHGAAFTPWNPWRATLNRRSTLLRRTLGRSPYAEAHLARIRRTNPLSLRITPPLNQATRILVRLLLNRPQIVPVVDPPDHVGRLRRRLDLLHRDLPRAVVPNRAACRVNENRRATWIWQSTLWFDALLAPVDAVAVRAQRRRGHGRPRFVDGAVDDAGWNFQQFNHLFQKRSTKMVTNPHSPPHHRHPTSSNTSSGYSAAPPPPSRNNPKSESSSGPHYF